MRSISLTVFVAVIFVAVSNYYILINTNSKPTAEKKTIRIVFLTIIIVFDNPRHRYTIFVDHRRICFSLSL